jgi:hypothetical protein
MGDEKVQVPSMWDVTDGEMRITLFPTGHLAVGLEEFMQKYGHDKVPDGLGQEVLMYLTSTWGRKILSATDGKRISDEVACIARAWLKKNPRG